MSEEDLRPEISLVDDLAADSLDLIEVALALEAEFGIAVPETLLDQVRTFGDLVDATVHLALTQRLREARRAARPVVVRARVVAPGGGATLERAVSLAPYAAEEIAEDARRAGRGARVELTVPEDSPEATLTLVAEQFVRLGPRGICVTVRRDVPPEGHGAHPHAA